MDVNISYRVALENVPKEISERLNGIKPHLQALEKAIDNVVLSLGQLHCDTETLKDIDAIRRELANIDGRLQDYALILAQYSKTTAEAFLAENNQQMQAVTVVEEKPQPQEIDLNELEEQMAVIDD